MRRLLDTERVDEESRKSKGSLWFGRILGFLGSGVILWIGMRALAPTLASDWNIPWILNPRIRTSIVVAAAVLVAAVLSKIEGTIWARYYVIIGYLLSLGLIIWIILRLLRYV